MHVELPAEELQALHVRLQLLAGAEEGLRDAPRIERVVLRAEVTGRDREHALVQLLQRRTPLVAHPRNATGNQQLPLDLLLCDELQRGRIAGFRLPQAGEFGRDASREVRHYRGFLRAQLASELQQALLVIRAGGIVRELEKYVFAGIECAPEQRRERLATHCGQRAQQRCALRRVPARRHPIQPSIHAIAAPVPARKILDRCANPRRGGHHSLRNPCAARASQWPAGGWLSSISTPSQLLGWMKITRQSCAPGPGSSLRNW